MRSGGSADAYSTAAILAYIDAAPLEQLPALKGALAARLCRETLAAVTPQPPPRPGDDGPPYTLEEAATQLGYRDPKEVRRLIARGELPGAYQHGRSGRWHVPRSTIRAYQARKASLVRGLDQRYSAPHDALSRQGTPAPTRLDPTRARRRAECDDDDRRPLGARPARRRSARDHDPYAPGQAAWSGPAPPAPKG